MNEQEFLQLATNYEKQWEKNPSNGSLLICAIVKRVVYLLEMMELIYPESDKQSENKERPLIDYPDCPCPYVDKNEQFVISYEIHNHYDIFHKKFWAYMAKRDPKFAAYCTHSAKSFPSSKKTTTYVQPQRALHYLLANGDSVTKNRIIHYFKILCQNNAPQKFAVPA